MARPKEFDVDEALDRATEVFWRHGYEATSLPMLLDAMGIGRQSLYDTFGGKHELFLAALERYDRWVADSVLPPLLAPDAGVDAIRAHFAVMVKRLTSDRPRRACLVANSTMECATRDPEVAGVLERSIARVHAALRHAVQAAQERGEISGRRSPRALARYLETLGMGLTVSAKAGASRRALQDTVDVALDALA